jgi:16S rRNA (cytosine967-C5)-methyltransferase
VALDVVMRVTDEGAYSNLALRRTLERAGLSERDASFASELVYGTLRRLVPIDDALAPLLDRPLETAPKPARAALRLGAYQLLYLRVPSHAAVAETVSLVGQRQRGFVNAVLRRLSSAEPRGTEGATVEAIALRTGLSALAIRELERLLGEEAEAAAAALAQRASTTLRVNTCRSSLAELQGDLAAAGVSSSRGRIHDGSLLVEAGARRDCLASRRTVRSPGRHLRSWSAPGS